MKEASDGAVVSVKRKSNELGWYFYFLKKERTLDEFERTDSLGRLLDG